jgi:NAD dependent epimerase/dehydratase family enzyme
MSVEEGSVFDVMGSLARRGLMGTAGSGRQFVSWIHGLDFVCALEFLIEHEEIDGAINVASPNPIPNADFNRILRRASGAKFGLLTPTWALEIGALLMGTETELILKSRRVVPGRLLKAGFEFRFPSWQEAATDLAGRITQGRVGVGDDAAEAARTKRS